MVINIVDDLKSFDKRVYPMYDTDDQIEVFFAKRRNGYNTDFYAYTYQTPFFCYVENSREAVYEKVDMMFEQYYEYKKAGIEV